ncbi:MAG: hypothetical protein K6T78_07960 [Alicyclobacillus sp.]|nr:hypothetical protein [Alicyclobacillus sp.]
MKKPLYKRWWFWTLCVVAFFFVILPVGMSLIGMTLNEPSTTAPTVVRNQTSKTVNSASNDTSSSSSPASSTTNSTGLDAPLQDADTNAANKISQYLKENFEGASWYSEITDIEVSNGHVDVYTTLYPDSEGRAAAKMMAGIIYGNISTGVADIQSVTIDARNGSTWDPLYTKYDWN